MGYLHSLQVIVGNIHVDGRVRYMASMSLKRFLERTWHPGPAYEEFVATAVQFCLTLFSTLNGAEKAVIRDGILGLLMLDDDKVQSFISLVSRLLCE